MPAGSAISRRQFLATGAQFSLGIAASGTCGLAASQPALGANERVWLAVCGIRKRGHLRNRPGGPRGDANRDTPHVPASWMCLAINRCFMVSDPGSRTAPYGCTSMRLAAGALV
jgi:hypothetical protein